jgi:uncharacterized membrane protein
MRTIEGSIIVHAPVAECYRRWCEFERFPEYMRRIAAVRKVAFQELTHADVTHIDENTWDPQKNYDSTIDREVAQQVQAKGGEVWHWEVRGPMNRLFSWNAGIVYREDNKAVGWTSTHDNDVATAGTVNFLQQPKDHTLIEVKMTYSAPLGPLGELIADMSNYGDNIVYECLEDFKNYLEREWAAVAKPSDESPVMRNEAQLRKQVGVPPTIQG